MKRRRIWFLFQNISNVFHAPQEVLDILQSLPAEKEPTKDINVSPEVTGELDLNEDGEVEIPEDKVIGTAAALFGEKIYNDISDQMAGAITQAADATTHEKSAEEAMLEQLKQAFREKAVAPIIETAKQAYGGDLRPMQQKKLESKIKADAENELTRKFGDYQIQARQLEKHRDDAVAAAETDEEAALAQAEFEARQKQAAEELKQALAASVDTLVQSAGQDVVRAVETEKKEQQKRTIEDGIKDHLRGFSRTIPSFLMAYGSDNTTLETFDAIIPDNVFQEVTSITLAQFRFLRDGGPYTDAETGEVKQFGGHLFDPIVFNDSVKEFLRMRTELADYFDETHTEDIFNYIPPQRTNQIFTPKWVVAKMADMLEQENPGCFDDPDATFADLYMKSGLYITEIVKRLYRSEKMKQAFPDDEKRLSHIMNKQVYGAAPTEIIYMIAMHYIFGYDAGIQGMTAEELQDLFPNFVLKDTAELAKSGEMEVWVEETFGKLL